MCIRDRLYTTRINIVYYVSNFRNNVSLVCSTTLQSTLWILQRTICSKSLFDSILVHGLPTTYRQLYIGICVCVCVCVCVSSHTYRVYIALKDDFILKRYKYLVSWNIGLQFNFYGYLICTFGLVSKFGNVGGHSPTAPTKCEFWYNRVIRTTTGTVQPLL